MNTPGAKTLDIGIVLSDISVMTETTDKRKLPAVVERFILHWGDMGDQWGVNRSVSQIHGLLYLAEKPMTAEDIADTLGMARSNVSNSIKELLAWNLIRRVPILGDRRDHFEAETDIWEVAARIAAGRKEREIDPAIAALRTCVSDAADDPSISPLASKRLKEMLSFTELVERWYTQMLNVPRPRLVALIRLGEKIVSLLPTGRSK
jgi:DNA-binding transcriptional regulator GbsR (MarR family)